MNKLPKLDIERIKRYNDNLKREVARSAQLRAELEFNTNELNRLCQELSDDLGIEVNEQNVEMVYMELVKKIENNLQVGEEMLNRIKEQSNNGEEAANEEAARIQI